MTKEFPLIPIEDGYVMVDDKISVNKDYRYWVSGENGKGYVGKFDYLKYGWPIVAHTGIPSLKDSKLPLFMLQGSEEKLIREAEKRWPVSANEEFKTLSQNPYKALRMGFVEGQRAAGGWTDEDMAFAFECGKMGYYKSYEERIRKKHPIAAVVETIASGKCKEDRCLFHTCNGVCHIPKVVDGHIQIKEFIYDNISK